MKKLTEFCLALHKINLNLRKYEKKPPDQKYTTSQAASARKVGDPSSPNCGLNG